jgi:DNA repair protein RecO (recombination protein O)
VPALEGGPGSSGRKRPSFSDVGIVLRSHKLGESDKIIRILTRLNGRRSAVAKGVRRTTSRFGARLEPFTCVRLHLHRGRTLDTVTQADIESSFSGLREDLGLFVRASAMSELVGNLTQEHEPYPEIFDLLLEGFRSLEAHPEDADFTLAFFAFRAMAEAGYELMVASCSNCGGALPSGEVSFSLHLGGTVCDRCRSTGKGGLGRLVRVKQRTRELFEWMSLNRLGTRPPGGEQAKREAGVIMERVIEHWLEKESRSTTVMRHMRGDAT